MRTEDRPPPPALRDRATGSRSGRSAPSSRTLLGHPRLVAPALRRHAGRDLGGPRAARPADPVRARGRAARAVGRVDADRRPAGRLRAAVGRLRARLARARGAATRAACAFATLTHAAGISSTGDAELDRRLPFDEPYRIPPATARPSREARAAAGASSRSARPSCAPSSMRPAATARAGRRADWRRNASARRRRLRVVDAILTGIHEPGTSHYELLRAFAGDASSDARRRRAFRARLSHARVRRLGAYRASAGMTKRGQI